MNITRETIKETIKTVMAEEADYKVFFKKALEKAGKSIPSMSDEEKKEFFNKIDAAWNAKGEKNEALKGDQHELDVDGDGDIEADDLADLRAGKKAEDEIDEKKNPGLWANIRAKQKRGEKPAHGNSQAHKDAVKAGKKINKESIVTEADNFAGWIAIDHRGKKIEIKKGEAKDLYNAKLLAIKKLKVPKSKIGLLAIKPAVNESAGCNCGCGTCSTSVNEGRAFINAARKAKEEGKTEFEFNGKTYPVTLKESLNELNPRLNKKVKSYLDAYLKGEKKNSPEHQHAIMLIMKGALTDANFHSEAKKLDKLFPKAKQSKYVGTKMEDVIEDKGIDIASWAKWDGYDIIDAFAFYTNMNIGGGFGNKLTALKESIVTEARLGKVSLLRSVESGDSSYVEGVKISPELAFELRMFLQRPMLARTRTGIAINNAQMKDAIGMLAKVGVHKRLSSGVKKEFADLLKKYNK